MNRRELLKNAGFLTSSVAVFGLAGCNSNEEQTGVNTAKATPVYKFPQGVVAADPKPASIILWTRVVEPDDDPVAQVPASRADVAVTLELSATSDFAELLIRPVKLVAKAMYDNTIRHKLTGLESATTYYYRFRASRGISRVGRFKTAPALAADISQLNFAFMACQDWSVNHWVGISALAQKDLDFVVHLGDYIYEAAGDSYQSENVEAKHDQLKIPSNTGKPGSTSAKIAVTTEDYRYLYKKYRTDPRLQELHAKFALIAIWDDHEFSDDCWQNNESYDNGSVIYLDPSDGSFTTTYKDGVLPLSNEQLGKPSSGTDTRQTQRRRSANRAWFEFMPADIAALDESISDNFATVKIYRDLQFGKLAHFVMTDERLYRADHMIPEAFPDPANPTQPLGSIGSRYFVPEDKFGQVQQGKMLLAVKAAADNPATDATTKAMLGSIYGKLTTTPAPFTAEEAALFSEVSLGLISVLGQTQRDWWKDKMKTSTSTWKFWGNEVSLLRMALDLMKLQKLKDDAAGDSVLQKLIESPYLVNADQWDGYSAERANLTGFLAANGIKNVVAVTGDIHAFFAGEVPVSNASYVEGSAALVDLVTAGISSSSFWSYLADQVGDFEAEVNKIKKARAANPTGYINTLESGSPLAALRSLVYVCGNSLSYEGVKAAVVPNPSALNADQLQAAYRQVFDIFVTTKEKSVAEGGYVIFNTLNETLAGDMGTIIQGLAGLPVNPYSKDVVPPPKQNPWIKYVETKTQGFITVRVTPAKVEATFHHTATLAASPTAANVVIKTKTVTVNNGSTQLTVS